MLPINLISLRQTYEACQSQAPELFHTYLDNFGIELNKQQEREDIMRFIDVIRESVNPGSLGDFYIGYTIPQISKEFDLLRIGSNFILDIEIKHQSTPEKIEKQLRQNRHYLLAVKPAVRIYSYIVSTGELYFLDERAADIRPATLDELAHSIRKQEIEKVEEIDKLFSPKQYLVSPLHSPEKFANQYYFLTNHQEEIKKDVLRAFSGPDIRCALISGTAGTGKTLLVYDISYHYKIRYRQDVFLIHCGKLSEGHLFLKNKDWNIYELQDYKTVLQEAAKSGGLVVIDEAQRIRRQEMFDIFEAMSSIGARFIFSYDPKQYLSNAENRGELFHELKVPYISRSLKTTIRTNKEIASFINKLTDLRRLRHDPDIRYKHVYLQYFHDAEALRNFLHHLKHREGWELLNYGWGAGLSEVAFPDYEDRTNKSVKDVIGLEFDRVAVVINEYFYYEDGRLYSKGHPMEYQLNQMLFQQMTRTRDELYVVIYRNLELLKWCLEILRK